MPGVGSLMAGRVAGYVQLLLGLLGLALTLAFSVRFFAWYFANYARLRGPQDDPFATFGEIWNAARWPLLGILVFGVSWLLALFTSWQILQEAKRQEPPKL